VRWNNLFLIVVILLIFILHSSAVLAALRKTNSHILPGRSFRTYVNVLRVLLVLVIILTLLLVLGGVIDWLEYKYPFNHILFRFMAAILLCNCILAVTGIITTGAPQKLMDETEQLIHEQTELIGGDA
jgi:predicted MFS family arabinose efflux permease